MARKNARTVLFILVFKIENPDKFNNEKMLICDKFGCHLHKLYVRVPSKI